MPTEEEERKAKAERAKKLLAKRKAKNAATAISNSSAAAAARGAGIDSAQTTAAGSAPPSVVDSSGGVDSARASLSIERPSAVELDVAGSGQGNQEVKDDVEEVLAGPPISAEASIGGEQTDSEEPSAAVLDGGGKEDNRGKAEQADAANTTSAEDEDVMEEGSKPDTPRLLSAAEEGVYQEPTKTAEITPALDEISPDASQPAAPKSPLATDATPITPRKTAPSPIIADRSQTVSAPSPSPLTTVHLQETISLLRSERSELSSRVSTLEAELVTEKRNGALLVEGRELVKGLEEEKASLQDRLHDLEGKVEDRDRLRQDVDNAKKQVVEVERERDQLREEISNVRGEQKIKEESAKKQVADAHREGERGREREAVLEQEIARLRTASTESASRISDLESQLNTIQSSSTDASSALTSLQAAHTELQESHDTLKDAYATLETAHASLDSELVALRSAHSSLEGQHEASASDLLVAEAELGTLKNSLSAEKKRADGLEKKKAALQSENDELVRQLEEMREKVVKVSEQLAEMTTLKEGLDHEVKVARAEAKNLQDAQQAEKQEREQLELARGKAETEARDRRRELEVTKQDLRDAFTRLEATERALEAASSSPNGARDSSSLSRAQQHQHQSVLAVRDRTLDYLPANVRHKRQVSLNALKARLGTHAVTNGNGQTSHASSTAGHGASTPSKRLDSTSVREQWGDEIMFCCPACEGDLINL